MREVLHQADVNSRYILDVKIFECIQSLFEEAYGLFLQRDVFAEEENKKLPIFGVPRDGKLKEKAVFVNTDFSQLSDTLIWLKREKVVSLLVVPVWENHLWYQFLVKNATHKFVFPLGTPLFQSQRTGRVLPERWRCAAFVLDTRFAIRPADLITIYLPSLDKISTMLHPPRQILPQQAGSFLSHRPKNHFNIEWFLRWGKGLPEKLLSDVLLGLYQGFPTHYRGGGEFLRDYSSSLEEEEEKKAIEKAEESVRNKWAAGPFEQPPFPNEFCEKQAIVTKSFTIPKHKWIKDGALRLIFHKSFPLGKSINSLTPRHDAASYFPKGKFKYFTFSMFVSMIARAGRGSLLTQFDAKDAYKQILVKPLDLNQQVFKAGGKFFVDFCASFGSIYGNDSYSTVGYAHCVCLSLAAQCPLLRHYVDNYIHITPFKGTDTRSIALSETERLERELKNSGLLFHQFEGPTTKIIFLGWQVDTEAMSICITDQRKLFMITFLEEWEGKVTLSLTELSSLIGLLIFLSQVVNGLKVTIGVLIEKRTAMTRSTSLTSTMPDRVRWAIAHVKYILQRWNGEARIYDKAWTDDKPDISIYCDIALDSEPVKAGTYGKGAFTLPSRKWFSSPWTEEDLSEAMREKKHSSTHLELLNMLEAVLFFAEKEQRVLCVCDSKSAVRIAKARYSATANRQLEQRLRDFDIECCKRDLSVRFRWEARSGAHQTVVDLISRGQVAAPPPLLFLFAHRHLLHFRSISFLRYCNVYVCVCRSKI